MRFLVERHWHNLFVLLGVSLLVFLLMRLTASIRLSDPEVNRLAGTPERADLLRERVLVPHIEAGKLADLLVLEADPLEQVGNLSRVRAVIKDGVVVREGPYLSLAPPPRP